MIFFIAEADDFIHGRAFLVKLAQLTTDTNYYKYTLKGSSQETQIFEFGKHSANLLFSIGMHNDTR